MSGVSSLMGTLMGLALGANMATNLCHGDQSCAPGLVCTWIIASSGVGRRCVAPFFPKPVVIETVPPPKRPPWMMCLPPTNCSRAACSHHGRCRMFTELSGFRPQQRLSCFCDPGFHGRFCEIAPPAPPPPPRTPFNYPLWLVVGLEAAFIVYVFWRRRPDTPGKTCEGQSTDPAPERGSTDTRIDHIVPHPQ